jgi:hypothetical protein
VSSPAAPGAPAAPAAPAAPRATAAIAAGFGQTLTLAVTLAVGAFLVVMALAVLGSHPQVAGLGAFTGLVNQQNQSAKSAVYLVSFAVILPLSLWAALRLGDRIAAGTGAAGLTALCALLVGGLAGMLILVRLSAGLPWGDGLVVVLAGVLLWAAGAGAGLWRAARPWPRLERLAPSAPMLCLAAGLLVAGAILCVTAPSSLHPVPLAVGAVLVGGLVAAPRWSLRRWSPRPRPRLDRGLDVAVLVVLALAIPNVVVFHATGQIPNIFVPPGVIADQQNYLLGSANQLHGGGALLVNVPVSQYGVGLIYFLDGWFHLVPIGYGTLGALDGILTALFYIAAYTVLRIAGVGRALAAAAIAVAVVGLIYSLRYGVGALPETGPLRFGLPMVLLAARTAEVRWPGRRAWPGIAFAVLGLSAVWAFEAFAYTALTFLAIAAAQAWLRPPVQRRRWLTRQLSIAVGACIAFHLVLALATLLVADRLPDWGQYLTYLRSFLLGGRAGAISYGFADWSPGLAVGVAAFASAAGALLLVRRAPAAARGAPAALIAIAGASAYAIGLLSYADNRSSTYLLPYVALPLVIAAGLWLTLLLRSGTAASAVRRGGVVFTVALAALVVSAAWPSIGPNFSNSALAHAYPGGGLRAAVHRLWHPPPIDPRAPEAVRLLNRYMPAHAALVVLPTDPDLGVEILMRAHRVNSLFLGDPVDDSLVPSLWMSRLSAQVAALTAGRRLLIDRGTEQVLAQLRAHPEVDPQAHPVNGGDQQLEWVLRALDRRFEIRPVYRDPNGLIVAQLAARAG